MDMEQRIDAIRKKARTHRVPMWSIAKKIGVSESSITRWMRYELTPERFDLMNTAIDEILKERNEANV